MTYHDPPTDKGDIRENMKKLEERTAIRGAKKE